MRSVSSSTSQDQSLGGAPVRRLNSLAFARPGPTAFDSTRKRWEPPNFVDAETMLRLGFVGVVFLSDAYGTEPLRAHTLRGKGAKARLDGCKGGSPLRREGGGAQAPVRLFSEDGETRRSEEETAARIHNQAARLPQDKRNRLAHRLQSG